MHPGKIASVLLALTVTTIVALTLSLTWAQLNLEAASPAQRMLLMSLITAGASVSVLVPAGFVIDRSISNLRRYIENAAAEHAGAVVPVRQWKWLRSVIRAITGAVDVFRQREQGLRTQLYDLEIRHRVSEAERRQIEAVMDALRDAVIVTDAFNEIVMANRAAATALGFDLQQAIHRSIDDVILDECLCQLIKDTRDTANFTDCRRVEQEVQVGPAGTERSRTADARRSASLARVPQGGTDDQGRMKACFEIALSCVRNHKFAIADAASGDSHGDAGAAAASLTDRAAASMEHRIAPGVTGAGGVAAVGGVVTILHDLSKEREVSQMKSDFVSKASHELRTPLSSIRAYVEMLVDGEFKAAGDGGTDGDSPQSLAEIYKIIHDETERLGRLIDNMLNISRIEAGIVQIDRKDVDVKALVERAVSTLEPQAREKQITLSTRFYEAGGPGPAVRHQPSGASGDAHRDLPRMGTPAQSVAPSASLRVEGDSDMIYQVVLNLISNAVKYTPAGGRVAISADTDNLTRSVLVSVTDSGVGIPAEALPRLFDKFFRVENSKRMAKGTGLGLSLCKHIVETLHRGQIGVESKPGAGSKFWFCIPMRYAGGNGSSGARTGSGVMKGLTV